MRNDTDIEMEVISCPLCREAKYRLLHREGRLQMVNCSSCQFIYLNPRPTEEALLRFYQDYLPEDESSVEAWERMMEAIFNKAANLIEHYKKGGKLLDVGAGFGFFLSEVKGRNWDVEGVEISQKAIHYARDVLGLAIQPGPLEKVGFPEGEFDVVSGFYVIEHLPQPMEFLKECYRVLKLEGILLLRYPHTTPIKNLLRFFGIKNKLYDLPAHLSDFSPEMIQQCLEKAGFKRCQHFIGGHTLPREWGKRMASSLFGNLSETLFHVSGRRFLFPGVSKTVLAFKG
jgi:2-polyprenyl-3-methyl-5-hydroxy-6-metoxy-1,4-benzoquinol methylase